MVEIWKDVEDYEGLYEVSNLGNVRSKRFWCGNRYVYRDKVLKPGKCSSGYLQVIFSKNGKTESKLIHRLVANAFLQNINNYAEINHKDENKENNNVTNLEWCSRKYNMNYGNVKRKISNNISKKIGKYDKNGNLLEIYSSIKEAAEKNGILSSTNIVQCCKHARGYNTCKGYKWKYI